MSQQRLTWLAAELRKAGLEVVEIDGWKTRSRPPETGNFNPVGVLWHHTGDTANGKSYAEWLARVGRSDLPAPLCQLSIDRQGVVYVIAAGRANHAGVAKASGSVAAGDGNSLYVGVECQNNGTEGWSKEQYDAMVTTGAVLGNNIPCSPRAQRGHKETSVTGKWDPGALDLDAFRTDIRLRQKDGFGPPSRGKRVDTAIRNLRHTRATGRTENLVNRARALLLKIPTFRRKAKR